MFWVCSSIVHKIDMNEAEWWNVLRSIWLHVNWLEGGMVVFVRTAHAQITEHNSQYVEIYANYF